MENEQKREIRRSSFPDAFDDTTTDSVTIPNGGYVRFHTVTSYNVSATMFPRLRGPRSDWLEYVARASFWRKALS